MRILYSAIDQTVPGTKGGSVHVTAVAEGLAALGHEVRVLVTPGTETTKARESDGRVRWIGMAPPLGSKQLRWARMGAVRRIAEAFRPDAIIERYYNFGGEAISVAAGVGATAVLEVNAPVVDHAGSMKALLDRALVVQPMRRWRERLCHLADLIVTPSAAILPPDTPREKVIAIEWGADSERFRPDRQPHAPFTRPAATVAIFSGAFRSWHGAIHLVTALGELQARGRDDLGAVFVGDGPELARVREAARSVKHVVFTGAVPHHEVPGYLVSADIGAAPFDLAAHRPLSLDFYWSPLKIFEYMASGLPVAAPAIDRLSTLVQHEREGLLYAPETPGALAVTLERLTDPELRARLGRAARERAVREYSWKSHCRALDEAIRAVRTRT
jgi:glycosyltransferase involved in cell wall biosynthesis